MKQGSALYRLNKLNLRSLFHEGISARFNTPQAPLRSALLSADQMRSHGMQLAGTHVLMSGSGIDNQLLSRLADNEDVLLEVRTLLADAIVINRRITPAGEWLLDNFYLIEEQIRTARRHLPKGYSRELPRLRSGVSSGLPRVYDIALETISHGDGRVDPENLENFVTSYQSVSILQLGELWAIPIMLRLALIENLRRVASRIASDMAEQNRADHWADRMVETAEKNLKSLILVVAEMVKSDPPMVSPFVAELARRLQGQSANLALPLTWIEQRLSESGLTIKHLVQAEIQQQAADQVSMSNSIGSLRFLGETDWHEFVESMSPVSKTLANDPSGFFLNMDFSTRDRYRHVVEEIAHYSDLSELEVAHEAIRLSAASVLSHGLEDRSAHVGYYLIDKGLLELERKTKMRITLRKGLQIVIRRAPLPVYLGSIALLSVLFTSALLPFTSGSVFEGWTWWAFVVFLGACMFHLSVALVNWITQIQATPYPLPRLDYREGIPTESKTLVVVPTMLLSAADTAELVEALEVRFLANQDPQVFFALLTDFGDAATETIPSDQSLLQVMSDKIVALNSKYRDFHGERFFLFHRPRRWNAGEKMWMGYERKRGKLADLNAFLRGHGDKAFSAIVGETRVIENIRYVITLDTDTQLPRDTARALVAAMGHPLNRPRYDESARRVVDGYGILQPRMTVILQGANRSQYAQLCGSEPGIDPYTRTVSDVYQDLFGEGSYIGKGIYDIDAFEMSLKDTFPENQVLSHDLLEGSYARAGLLSDVQLLEEHPSRYATDVKRRRRWIRGDWQIIAWILPFLRDAAGKFHKNPVSALSRWKIIDNLRRSVMPIALFALLVLSWTLLAPAWLWSLVVLGIIAIPSLIVSVMDMIYKPDDVLWRQHLVLTRNSSAKRLGDAGFSLACMPYEAYFSAASILTSIWRMVISHTRLLEWNTAAHANAQHRNAVQDSYRTMWAGPFAAVLVASVLLFVAPLTLYIAAPFLVLWLASPAIAWALSRPLTRKNATLDADQTAFLRHLSRKIWAFFETFMSNEDNWLPPDNYQEYPVKVVAHRTSPTNIGFSLLANLSAYDFGYVSASEFVVRTTKTLQTMDLLERHRGHFYNWYDTTTLKPLAPRYISSVDSGNLAAYLLVLRSGIGALADDLIVGHRLFDGLQDSLNVLLRTTGSTRMLGLIELKKAVESPSVHRPLGVGEIRQALDDIQSATLKFSASCAKDIDPQITWWTQAIERQSRDALEHLDFFCPWAIDSELLAQYPELNSMGTLNSIALQEAYAPQRTPEMYRDAKARAFIELASLRASERILALKSLALRAGEFAVMEYAFLYDRQRRLLSIGYNADHRRKDPGSYDLLASEARLASFVGIAQGAIPQENWFALSRQLTSINGSPVLLSWSGSMFEYLMPLLVMPNYEYSLLDQTYTASVKHQMDYGKFRGVPWGISESGYFLIDAAQNYQYRAFGVPGLGLKRGLADDLVVAPYATALALMVAPEEACENLQRLSEEGFEGDYGLFEAIDYSSARIPHTESKATVRSFMSHHQGMSLLALSYVLLDRPMQRRFNAEPMFAATNLLLQERVPKDMAVYSRTNELPEIQMNFRTPDMPLRIFATADTPVPEVQLLSNGSYHVMVTNSGGGYSRWNNIAVTRWREDASADNWGSFCYLRDVASGQFWSTTYQPTLKKPKQYEAIFSEGRAEFQRTDFGIDTHTTVLVSPEDDIELRRTRITNRTRSRREIEVSSYAEVVLSPNGTDALHPAFGNLFVQTEIDRERHTILCHRRPRSKGEKTPWFFHLMSVYGATASAISYETDRAKFIGRGNNTSNPSAMSEAGLLSDSSGSVLDPIVSIRYRIVIEPEQVVTIDLVSGIGPTRAATLALAGKYQDRRLADRVFDLAWTHSQVVLRQLNATEADAQLYGHLASSVIFANGSLRADPAAISRNHRGQSGLWGYSISGDLPIVLVQIEDAANINLVRQMVQAHQYWRQKGLMVDLVIWNEDHAGYRQVLNEQILGLLATGAETRVSDAPGGIFVRSSDQISVEDRILIQASARAVLQDSRGSLAEQISRRRTGKRPVAALIPSRGIRQELIPSITNPSADLQFFNGYGGFSADGKEYVIQPLLKKPTPAPWVNVIANPHFGTVVSENGGSYTWAENAHEFRLSPWANDPVSDISGEALYIRDEETGQFWMPMSACSESTICLVTRHGFGYSTFEQTHNGIHSEVCVFVADDASVKFTLINVRNVSGRSRKLSVTGYVEWVLGDIRPKTAMHVVTELDPVTTALCARNGYSTDFPGRVAFFDVDEIERSITGDRNEFLGRNGVLSSPSAMGKANLSGRVGAALDPCAAIQIPFDIAEGGERELVFRLGLGRDSADATVLVRRFRGIHAAHTALSHVKAAWKHRLEAVQVETPDRSLDLLANGWLLYQTISCRLWGRSGYYQSGGAFGFRDQLQDSMAMIHTEPGLLREQILLCASRQFTEGDVQHWWHPPTGKGVRTRCSDDFLWLPLATARYVHATGDREILQEPIRFLSGRLLNVGEESYYDMPGRSDETASLYLHCMRAISHGESYGSHGLPLMGSGDWNDGMNLVGEHGIGESIWLGFFFYTVLNAFAPISEAMSDQAFADHCRLEATTLQTNIEASGWDGNWYRRAYFDDGTALGSATNQECRIDSIAQSWSVLSGAGSPTRSQIAMESLDQHLVRRDHGLIQLLNPPFDTSEMEPGYIKGYVPGVRENGGQYTHAAIWAAMAFAQSGDPTRAWELAEMINPIKHALNPTQVAVYAVEPYVIAADVYGVAPHTGRGGWTWYTGSAGWMYRLIMESLLGLRLEGAGLHFDACLPSDWTDFTVHYRYGETKYTIYLIVQSLGKPAGLIVDGAHVNGNVIPLIDDGIDHKVVLKVFSKAPRA